MKQMLIAIAILSSTALPAFAANWTIDRAKSRIGFTATQTGMEVKGRFATFTAEISFDPAKPEAGHAMVVIDMASAVTGDQQRDTALPQTEWFDVKDFAKARFEAKSFVTKGGNAYEADGTLTIRDITKPCVLPFTLTLAANTAHAVGHLKLTRTDFGVGQGAWASGEWVALDVGVDVDLTATGG